MLGFGRDPGPRTILSEPETPSEREADLFAGALRRLTPHAIVSYGLVVANVAVWVTMVTAGVSARSPGVEALIAYGANQGALTAAEGQWWRLVSATFVHVGLAHLAFNMLALLQIGPLVERLLGNGAFVVAYVLAGVVGSLASLLYHPPALVSAGASGAIFGVIGALLAVVVTQRDSIPHGELRRLRLSALSFVGYNLVVGLVVPAIDMAAHLGGLAAGFVVALPLARPIVGEPSRARPLLIGAVAAMGALAVAGLTLLT
ncbi:MAG: rhomboid family intramembrane serine protease [Polyangiaceae bacterium]